MQVLHGSATGPSHVRLGKPCEDHYSIKHTSDGRWTCATLSDGCGSMSNAEEGARFISGFVTTELIELAPKIDTNGPGDWVVDEVIAIMLRLRTSMRSAFKDPSTYAATIVATLVSQSGGLIIHVGDGIAVSLSTQRNGTTIVQAKSEPENGEFAGQTFYITEGNWLHHLRITPLAQSDAVILCTDGAQDILFSKNIAYAPAFLSLFNELSQAQAVGIEKFLSSAEAEKRSSDDKSLVLIVREPSLSKWLGGGLNLQKNLFSTTSQNAASEGRTPKRKPTYFQSNDSASETESSPVQIDQELGSQSLLRLNDRRLWKGFSKILLIFVTTFAILFLIVKAYGLIFPESHNEADEVANSNKGNNEQPELPINNVSPPATEKGEIKPPQDKPLHTNKGQR